MTTPDLIDAELVILDGQCRPEVQAAVDKAKARLAAVAAHPELPERLAGLVADAVGEATTTGLLVCWSTPLRWCRLCGADPGYALYKSGPRRGMKNLDKPLRLPGRELARRNVHIQGAVTPKRKRYDDVKCKLCGWEGHEGQMGRLPTLIGDGSYPAYCARRPECRAENGWGRSDVERTGGFTIVVAEDGGA